MTTETINNQQPTTIKIGVEQCAGHGDHWALLTDNIAEDVPQWLQSSISEAIMPHGLHPSDAHLDADGDETLGIADQPHVLVAGNQDVHIKQVLALLYGTPNRLINAFPAVNSPYGITAKIERIIACDDNLDAVLRLKSADGTVLYAFDQLYAINHELYDKDTDYYINLSAWAYRIKPSDSNEVIVIEDQDAIRYHRAYNDIVARNDGKVPDDIQQQIEAWQPDDSVDKDAPLLPIEVNMGNMCAYLFGETLGQEDDCWCQGQVLGKQETEFNGVMLTLFDVVILREPDVDPVVVRVATRTNAETNAIAVEDYIQANLWMQASIYAENQYAEDR